MLLGGLVADVGRSHPGRGKHVRSGECAQQDVDGGCFLAGGTRVFRLDGENERPRV